MQVGGYLKLVNSVRAELSRLAHKKVGALVIFHVRQGRANLHGFRRNRQIDNIAEDKGHALFRKHGTCRRNGAAYKKGVRFGRGK